MALAVTDSGSFESEEVRVNELRLRGERLQAAIGDLEAACEPARGRVALCALEAARSHEDDRSALAAVALVARENRWAAEEARRQLEVRTPTYGVERAARLIDAALADSDRLAPPDTRLASLFEEEEALARVPVREALAWLCEREPELERVRAGLAGLFSASSGVVQEPMSEAARELAMARARAEAVFEIAEIVGPRSRQRDRLLRSSLTREIALRVVQLASGNPARVDFDAPYFSR